MTILSESGIYEIDEDEYHADPAAEPSLSRSIAEILLQRCPKAAWWAHSRLHLTDARDGDTKFDLGTAAHTMLLGKGKEFRVIEAADYRKQTAQIERDVIRKAGMTPILAHQYENALRMTNAARQFLPDFDGGQYAFNAAFGSIEACALVRDVAGCWSRALIDFFGHAVPTGIVCWDYKTTSGSANPTLLTPHASRMGWAFQAAYQERILLQLKPELAGRLKFRFFVQENEPPHLCSVVEPDGAAMTLAHKMCAAALAIWSRCLKTGVWPSYPQRNFPIGVLASTEAAWIARELDDELVQLAANDLFLSTQYRQAPSAPYGILNPDSPPAVARSGRRGPRGKYRPRKPKAPPAVPLADTVAELQTKLEAG